MIKLDSTDAVRHPDVHIVSRRRRTPTGSEVFVMRRGMPPGTIRDSHRRRVPTPPGDHSPLDHHILTTKWSGRIVGEVPRLRRPAMDTARTDVIQGTLDMLILKTLSLQPMHGFGIARRIEQITRGVFKVNPGSLLTALQRLERSGWLDAEWRQSENGRRAKYYRLTKEGQRQLEVETADWARRAGAIGRLLRTEA